MAAHVYKPSDRVPVSGVYSVEHRRHRDAHEATLLEGEFFPVCAVCQGDVRFTLKQRASKIQDDKDFAAGK